MKPTPEVRNDVDTSESAVRTRKPRWRWRWLPGAMSEGGPSSTRTSQAVSARQRCLATTTRFGRGSRDGAGVHALDSFDNGADGEFARAVSSRGAERTAAVRITQHRGNAPRQRRHVPGRDQDPGDSVDDHVDDASGSGCHYRPTRSHRLEHDGRTGVGPHRRDNDRLRGPEQVQYLVMWKLPMPLNTIR